MEPYSGAVIQKTVSSGADAGVEPDSSRVVSDASGLTDSKGVLDGHDISHSGWFGLGGSEFAPHAVRVSLGSAGGGGVSANSGESMAPSLAVDPAGHPIVAWHDDTSGNFEIYLRRWNGTTWEELGGSGHGPGLSNTAGSSEEPVLALDKDGNPIVAWQDSSASAPQIYLRRWNGTTWEELGGSGSGNGISNTPQLSLKPALALDKDGNPIVAWQENIASKGIFEIYVKQWNGTEWQELGGSGSNAGISEADGRESSDASIAIDPNGRVVVAWHGESLSDSEIFLRRWNGTTWEDLAGSGSGGGISANGRWSKHPSLAIDGSGNPALAWDDAEMPSTPVSETPAIYFRRWNGQAWEALGGSASESGVNNTAGRTMYPSLSFDPSGKPVIAWDESQNSLEREIHARRWDGTSWQPFEGTGHETVVSANYGPSEYASLAVDTNGKIIVAWHDGTSGHYGSYTYYNEIYVRQWNGTSWEGYGGTGEGGAVSQDVGAAACPAIELEATGKLTVVWNSDTMKQIEGTEKYLYNVYARFWDGANWTELGGSGSGEGVSNNQDQSQFPALARTKDGHSIAAWRNSDSPFLDGCPQVYLRSWNGSIWEELDGSASAKGVSQKVGCSPARPAVAVDTKDTVFLAWDDNHYPAESEIYLRQWNGTKWVELGGSGSGNGISQNSGSSQDPSLVVDQDDYPIVAWQDKTSGNFEIYVRRWNGTSWEELGGSASGGGVSNNQGWSGLPSLAMDINNRPVLAWLDDSSGSLEVYLRRWNGTSWEELGGSGSAQGISQSGASWHHYRSYLRDWHGLAIDKGGNPVVAWVDGRTGQFEIYLRRWNGTMWDEIDGSATDGGISNSEAASFNPTITTAEQLICVAWSEMGQGSREIVVRCHDL